MREKKSPPFGKIVWRATLGTGREVPLVQLRVYCRNYGRRVVGVASNHSCKRVGRELIPRVWLIEKATDARLTSDLRTLVPILSISLLS